jgi:hypothetical protein
MAMNCWSASYNAILWQIRQNQKMNSILPIFACGLVLAAWSSTSQAQTPLPLRNAPTPQGGTETADSNSGDALLHHAIAAIDAQPSIAAKVRHRIDVLGRPLIGSGIYLQQGRGAGRMLRFDLNLQMSQQSGSLQQVCDGSNLWMSEDLGTHKELSWVDMARLARAKPKSPGAAPPANMWLALGGLSKLLGGIESSFHCGPVAENQLEDLRVWTVEAQWKPARLIQLLPEQKEAIETGKSVNLAKLAPNLPDLVVLHFGCDDFFPYRIEFWRSSNTASDTKANDRGKLLVLVELYEVRLGAPIDPQQFTLARGELKPIDRTPEFLDRLGLEDKLPSGANQKQPPRR